MPEKKLTFIKLKKYPVLTGLYKFVESHFYQRLV